MFFLCSAEKPYECEVCGRQFIQKGNLAVHKNQKRPCIAAYFESSLLRPQISDHFGSMAKVRDHKDMELMSWTRDEDMQRHHKLLHLHIYSILHSHIRIISSESFSNHMHQVSCI